MCERQRDISFILKCVNLSFPAANKQWAIRKTYPFLSYLRSYLHKSKYDLGGKCSSTKHCNSATHFFVPLPTNPEKCGRPTLNINMKRQLTKITNNYSLQQNVGEWTLPLTATHPLRISSLMRKTSIRPTNLTQKRLWRVAEYWLFNNIFLNLCISIYPYLCRYY